MRGVAAAIVGLAVIAAAVTGAVLALFTTVGFELLDFHPVALDYMDGRMTRVEISTIVIEGQTFGANEIDHLDDVAALLGVLGWVFAISLAVFVVALVARARIARLGAALALSGLAVAGILVVGAYLVFGFVPVGEVFHEVLFPQGNWRFPWYSLIIRLYGTEVMLRGAAFVIVAGLLGLVAALAVGTIAARRAHRVSNHPVQ